MFEDSQKQHAATLSQINNKLEEKKKDTKSLIRTLVRELLNEELKCIIPDIVHTFLSQIKAGTDHTLKGVHSVDRKTTLEGTEDTISQVTESFSDIESQHTNKTGEEQELLSIDNNKQFLTQETVKGNETDHDVENVTIKDKSIVEEPAQQETEKSVMTTVMLTRKQRLLQQRCAGYTTEESDTGENPTNHE
eukprot:5590025-Ditylum_brightwellii.AAC.1